MQCLKLSGLFPLYLEYFHPWPWPSTFSYMTLCLLPLSSSLLLPGHISVSFCSTKFTFLFPSKFFVLAVPFVQNVLCVACLFCIFQTVENCHLSWLLSLKCFGARSVTINNTIWATTSLFASLLGFILCIHCLFLCTGVRYIQERDTIILSPSYLHCL